MSGFLGTASAPGWQRETEIIRNYDGNVVSFSYSGIEILSVRHEITLDEAPREENKYISCLCYSGRSSAADIARVEFSGPLGNERLGFVFPANSFSEAGLIEGGWPAYFAEVGFRRSLTIDQISKLSPLRLPSEAKSLGRVSFDEVFGEYSSVLVMSIEAIKRTKMSLEELELSLIISGLYPLNEQLSSEACKIMMPQEGAYKLRRVSSFFTSDAGHFLRLFRRADRDGTGVGAFLTYYQVIEYCIAYILEWSVRELSTNDLDAWKLRDALSDASNEKSRFNKLYSHHTSHSCDHSIFEEVRQAAFNFLGNLDVKDFEGWGWCEALYKSRNMIVHNQITIFRSGTIEDLRFLNKAMRSACLQIVTHFVRAR